MIHFLFNISCTNRHTLRIEYAFIILTMKRYRVCQTARQMFYIQRGYKIWKWILWTDVREVIAGDYTATKLFFSIDSIRRFLKVSNNGITYEVEFNF